MAGFLAHPLRAMRAKAKPIQHKRAVPTGTPSLFFILALTNQQSQQNTHPNNNNMKISTSAFTMAISLPVAMAESLFQPASAVFSNLDAVSQLPPQVVLGYLADCANVANIAVPENADCLFDNFVTLQFPGQDFGDSCSPPTVSPSEIATNLRAANALCTDDLSDFIGTATFLIFQVFEAESCWSSLCSPDDDSLLRVESQYLEQCTGVELPYPTESSDDMFLDSGEKEDAILTCMLDHVMNTPALEFGLAEPPVQCWPPAYDTIGAVCPNALAKPAFEHCTKNTAFFDILEEDMVYMSMSMMMDDNDDYKPDDEMLLMERFCAILNGLTTDKGLECLGIICKDASAMPSGAPSDEWSAMPSGAPSEELSAMPSAAPSEASSAIPSLAPSSMPSLAPSSMPSASPSAAPSALPSTSPTASPSSSPTASPSSEPSMAPSSAPTLEELQYIVEVELVSEFTLDMTTSNIPNLLDEIVEDSILDVLSSFGNGVDVTVQSVNGNTLRRRLQNAIPVQFSVRTTEECYHSDCNAFAANLIASLNNALLNAVVDGSMATYIRQEASTRSVDVLTSVNVIANSYQLIRSESQLNEPVIISNPEGVQSAASMVSAMTSLGLLAVALVAF